MGCQYKLDLLKGHNLECKVHLCKDHHLGCNLLQVNMEEWVKPMVVHLLYNNLQARKYTLNYNNNLWEWTKAHYLTWVLHLRTKVNISQGQGFQLLVNLLKYLIKLTPIHLSYLWVNRKECLLPDHLDNPDNPNSSINTNIITNNDKYHIRFM